MRGTGFVQAKLLLMDRFIPAHAGNRSAGLMLQEQIAVHPRACGEQAVKSFLRGHRVRFIPAHAGNSFLPTIAASV